MKLFTSKAIGWRLVRMSIMAYVLVTILVYVALGKLALPTWAISEPYVPGENSFTITTEDSVTISAEWHPVPSAKKTILFSHGNGEHIGQLRTLIKSWQAMGFSVLSYDYRGYGASEGSPSERGVERDIEAAWHWLVNTEGIAPGDIVIYGRSIGGGPSAWLAARVDCGGLVLESSFTNLLLVPTRGVRILPFDPFPTIKRLPKIDAPLLIVHGTHDQLIHPFHAERNFQAAAEPKQLLWIEGAGHNDLHTRTGATYEAAMQTFLK